MNRVLKTLLLCAAAFLLATHRLPAPISEVQESPTPAPSLAPTPASTTAQPPVATAGTALLAPAVPGFGGTWTGKISEGKSGDLDVTLVINADGTSLQQTSKHGIAIRKTTSKGKTVFWTGGLKNDVLWSLTPNSDRQTALVTRKFASKTTSATFRHAAPGQRPAGPTRPTDQHPRKQRKQSPGY
jgi:hypothetical protein